MNHSFGGRLRAYVAAAAASSPASAIVPTLPRLLACLEVLSRDGNKVDAVRVACRSCMTFTGQ
eukprot:10725537-Prorocentrum_lima.AAC.1